MGILPGICFEAWWGHLLVSSVWRNVCKLGCVIYQVVWMAYFDMCEDGEAKGILGMAVVIPSCVKSY